MSDMHRERLIGCLLHSVVQNSIVTLICNHTRLDTHYTGQRKRTKASFSVMTPLPHNYVRWSSAVFAVVENPPHIRITNYLRFSVCINLVHMLKYYIRLHSVAYMHALQTSHMRQFVKKKIWVLCIFHCDPFSAILLKKQNQALNFKTAILSLAILYHPDS